MGRIFLVTGEIESGKTSFCRRVAYRFKAEGWDVAGLLSPAVFQVGRKTAIDAIDLRNETRRRLAELNKPDAQRGEIQTKRWRFSPTVLEWCNQVLKAAVPCDLLVIDELGPLEFERSKGLLAGLEAIDSGLYRLSLTVVRLSLIEKALNHWQAAETVEIDKMTDTTFLLDEWTDQYRILK